MIADVISKPVYRVLADLTQEARIEVALPLAIKEWVALKLQETQKQLKSFEATYGMNFETFEKAWHAGHIPNQYSYEVEQDFWEWEAAISDEQRLTAMIESLA